MKRGIVLFLKMRAISRPLILIIDPQSTSKRQVVNFRLALICSLILMFRTLHSASEERIFLGCQQRMIKTWIAA